jgi:hypothetical protein
MFIQENQMSNYDDPPLQASVVHCKRDKFDIYIGRPGEWGNPFSHKPGTKAQFRVSTRDEAIEEYRKYLIKQLRSGEVTLEQLQALQGKVLGCWCHPKPCHGDILVKAAKWACQQYQLPW